MSSVIDYERVGRLSRRLLLSLPQRFLEGERIKCKKRDSHYSHNWEVDVKRITRKIVRSSLEVLERNHSSCDLLCWRRNKKVTLPLNCGFSRFFSFIRGIMIPVVFALSCVVLFDSLLRLVSDSMHEDDLRCCWNFCLDVNLCEDSLSLKMFEMIRRDASWLASQHDSRKESLFYFRV
jgi:hypothetical protein